MSTDSAPLVAHIIFRLDVGGLENGLVNLINEMPEDRFRHVIICLTQHTEFRNRLSRQDVALISLEKREGKDFGMYWRLWKVLRKLRPDIVHTRNIGTLDCMPTAMLARVPHRVHGEHGRDIADVHGENRKYLRLRRICRPMVHKFVPMSRDLAIWLHEKAGVESSKIVQIYNGVDSQKFQPAGRPRVSLPVADFATPNQFVIGSVGRMDPVKDQITLVKAFLHLRATLPDAEERIRLVHIGDGRLRDEALELMRRQGASQLAWLPGARDDIPALLRGFDLFVLPSLAEGISNTILEAMATGLPVVATRVGGNPELVTDGVTGSLVPPNDHEAMAVEIASYLEHPERVAAYGRAARERVESQFSLTAMVDGYLKLYENLLAGSSAIEAAV